MATTILTRGTGARHERSGTTIAFADLEPGLWQVKIVAFVAGAVDGDGAAQPEAKTFVIDVPPGRVIDRAVSIP